ncbi:MAG: alpha/beta hydrolase [Gemmatimonadaceae bacterium]
MNPETRTVEHKGCRLAYEVVGLGEPVLFIQGTGVHGAAWRPQTDVLCTEYSCLSFDNRGMSRSQPRGVEITIEQMAEDALKLIAAEKWETAHVVGHSLGGIVAQEVALQAKHRVRSLSLLCTFSRGRDAMQLTPAMIWTGLRTRIGTKRMRRQAFLELMMPAAELAKANADEVAANLAPVFGHDLADQPAVVMAQMRAMGRYDARPRVAALRGIPTMVVSAELDRISPPAVGRRMAAEIPGAAYHEIAGAAHGAPLQRAGEINALLRAHWRAVDSAT